MKTDLFQSCGHCWDFQLLAYWVQYSKSSSLRVWSSSAGILPPPLVFLVVMLHKAHLTSHSRISGSRWVTTPLWLSRSLRPFLYSSFVYYCHLFLISCAYVRSLQLLSFTMLILAWEVPLVSPIFLKKSLVFTILLFSSVSLHCSLEKGFLSTLGILYCYLLLFEEIPPPFF